MQGQRALGWHHSSSSARLSHCASCTQRVARFFKNKISRLCPRRGVADRFFCIDSRCRPNSNAAKEPKVPRCASLDRLLDFALASYCLVCMLISDCSPPVPKCGRSAKCKGFMLSNHGTICPYFDDTLVRAPGTFCLGFCASPRSPPSLPALLELYLFIFLPTSSLRQSNEWPE